MKIDFPQPRDTAALRALWQEAFGDDDAFLDLFFTAAYSPRRCRCITANGQIAAALYWLDCRWNGQPIAYLYAVATEKSMQGQGLCRQLMADTHRLLESLGYAGCILCPGSASLFKMYAAMGYRPCTRIREFFQTLGEEKASLRPVDAEEYARLRRQWLPVGGVLQEGENLTFLAELAHFYVGPDFLLCAADRGNSLFAMELLGNADAAPGILTALGKEKGTFRTPGLDREFTMYYPLTNAPAPTYLGFVFD